VWHLRYDHIGFFSPETGVMLHESARTLYHKVRT
jgi:hypothetical protein